MILAEDVFNRDGRLLFSKDRQLSEKDLKILKMWGVTQAAVHDGPAGETLNNGNVDTAVAKELSSYLARRFLRNDKTHPLVKTVFLLCRSRLIQHVTDNPAMLDQIRSPKPRMTPESLITTTITPVKDLNSLFQNTIDLPALPTIFSEISDAVQNPGCSAKDIADIVSKDTSLSAKLLQIVNSAYYGSPNKIESLPYAAVALGTNQIKSLAIGISVINYFKGIPNQCLSMQSFWKHSVACAITARTLGSQIKGIDTERIFLGGLLHDIGRLILLNHFPEASSWMLDYAVAKKQSLYKIEPEVFSLTHAELGSLIARSWHFSDNLTTLIQDHHGPFDATVNKESALIHVADWLIHALEIGSSGQYLVPELSISAWDSLELSRSTLAPAIKQIDRQVNETIQFFYE